MSLQTLGVVGAGQMGNGIAHVAAVAGFDVVLTDISEAALEGGMAAIRKNLGRMVKKEKITAADADVAVARVRTSTDLGAHEAASLVAEAATENETLKLEIFEALSAQTPPEAILATNTSSISITAIPGHPARR